MFSCHDRLHHRQKLKILKISLKSPTFCEAIQDGSFQKLSQKTKIRSALALKALLLPELKSF